MEFKSFVGEFSKVPVFVICFYIPKLIWLKSKTQVIVRVLRQAS